MSRTSSWTGLFAANFLGVFNDNFIKSLACFVSIYWLPDHWRSAAISIVSAMLVIPYIFFSPVGGILAKSKLKRTVLLYAKFFEIPIIMIGCWGFYVESIYLVSTAIFLMGLQSALYSPSKYGLIRDIGGKERISFGTGMMEMLIFLGVLTATIAASFLSDHYVVSVVCSLMLAVACIGYLSGFLITATEELPESASNETANPLLFIIQSFRWASRIPSLRTVILILSGFWFIAALIQMTILRHCPSGLHMTNTETGIVMALAAIGIAGGCVLSGFLSGSSVKTSLVLIGSIGLSICLSSIWLFNPSGYYFTILIFLAAFCSGFYKVPLTAWIQEKVEGRMLGEIFAFCNLMDFIFILFSSIVFGLVASFFGTHHVFLFLAFASVFLCIITALFVPGVLFCKPQPS